MSELIVFSYQTTLERNVGPRRFRDPFRAPPEVSIESIAAFQYRSEVEMIQHHLSHRPSRWDPFFEQVQIIWTTLKHLTRFRKAKGMVCVDNRFFWVLIPLSYLRLIPQGIPVIRTFFLNQGIEKGRTLMRLAPHGFQGMIITDEQESLALQHWKHDEKILKIDWCIDTDWFSPENHADIPEHQNTFFVPGNIERDENLCYQLAERGHSMVRAGQGRWISQFYASKPTLPTLEVKTNLEHTAYRNQLRSSLATVLPIRLCGEPAGQTAALESIACEIPLITNHSMGIERILKECDYPLTMIRDERLEAWEEKMIEVKERRNEKKFVEALKHARDVLVKTRHVAEDGSEWYRLFPSWKSASLVKQS